MQNRLFVWSLTAALAGFLFGFDTVVISGAEKTIQSLWQLSPGTHGWAMSMALWGTVLGSMIGGFPTDKLGRKSTLLWIGILYFVSALWSAIATDVYSFMIARFIGGLGVGISTVAAPLYISEISPSGKRGLMAGMFQFNIVFGILVALISNALISGIGENAWRWMLGIEAVPAIIYTVLCFSLPRSPRWLIAVRNDRPAAENILAQINPDASEAEISQLANEIEQAAPDVEKSSGFWSTQLKKPITLAFLIAFFNQLSGINIILYFAPRLLGLAGFEDPFTAAIGLGLVNLVFTFVGLWLIDKLGRKSLLLIGSIGYILSLGICGWAFLTNTDFKVVSSAQNVIDSAAAVSTLDAVDYRQVSESEKLGAQAAMEKAAADLALVSNREFSLAEDLAQTTSAAEGIKQEASKKLGASSLLVLACLLAFIASHAVGQGAVIWVFISEIFPNSHRAAGQSLGSFTHWIFAAILTVVFPIVIANVDAGWLFVFFCGMMCLQLLWVLTMVPETRGVPLEAIQEKLGIGG